MAKGRPVVLAGLDIGTSKTAVVIAAIKSAAVELLGVGESPSIGVQKGIVTDIDSAAKSIGQALAKAEKMAGLKIDSAYLSHNGASIQVRDCRVEHPAADHPVCNGGDNKTPNFSTPTVSGIPDGEEPLQIISPRIKPCGFGAIPGWGARIITARTGDLANMIQSVSQAGLEVQGIIYGPLAGAEVLLSPAEREFGTIFIDIGAGVTSISIFAGNMIKETAVIGVGGEHLAGDLAIGLRTSLNRAEQILQETSLEIETDEAEVSCLTAEPGDKEDIKCPSHLAGSIIKARAMEILDFIDESIKSFNYPGLLPGGVVLSGGVSRLGGLDLLAKTRLQNLVKTSSVEISGVALSPACANALGLVKYAGRHFGKKEKHNLKKRSLKKAATRFLNWFHEQLNEYKDGQLKD